MRGQEEKKKRKKGKVGSKIGNLKLSFLLFYKSTHRVFYMCNGHFFYLMISRTVSRVSIDIEKNLNGWPHN